MTWRNPGRTKKESLSSGGQCSILEAHKQVSVITTVMILTCMEGGGPDSF